MIRDLLKKPFGPYKEELVLDDKCTSSEKSTLTLTHYLMECGGEPIGFDESENRDNPRIQKNIVRFRGTLEIQNLSWLTPIGQELIETELRERDIKLYGPGVAGKGLSIRVVIQCEKLPMSAAYYHSPLAPQGLVVYSKVARRGRADLSRGYNILTVDISTYERSHNFLRRYQLLYLMERIVDEEHTPKPRRTINYFVDVYLRKFCFTKWHRDNRWIFNEKADSDVDENGHTKLLRHPRRIHRSEVISIFASQAEWIYEDQRAKPPKLRVVDLEVWKEFCMRVRFDRKEAANKGIRWGVSKTQDTDFKSEECEDVLTPEPVKVKSKTKGKGKQHYKASPPLKRCSSTSSRESVGGSKRIEYHYDNDFGSVSPDGGATASDDDYFDDPPIDPELSHLLPRSFHQPPALPGSDFKWFCEVHDCPYSIDLLHPSDEDLEGLGQNFVDVLRSKLWKSVQDDQVAIAFYRMVDRHRRRHLKDWGIKLTDPMTSKASVVWINPKRHRPWPEPEPVRTKDMLGRVESRNDDDCMT